MIEELTYKEMDFSAQYISLRQKEGRIYSDDEVTRLPKINKGHRYYFEWMIRKRSCDRLIKYLKDRKKPLEILEVGCGNGWLSAKLSSIPSSRVVGADINSEELNQAKRVFQECRNLVFLNGTLQGPPLSAKQFDIVIFAASIQYFKSLRALLSDVLPMLKSDGEIHILDSHFYKKEEVQAARQRSRTYFQTIGFPEMIDQYFHHSLDEIGRFDHKILYDPHSLFNKLRRDRNPFYWIRIKADA